jgi:DNA-binding response OmpR family regulator
MDIEMPLKNGLDVATELRKKSGGSKLTVFFRYIQQNT